MPVDYGEPLSDREREIVALVAEGLTNREIALRLFVSPNTIKVHLRNIFTKTGVGSRTELSMLAVQEGWVQVAAPASEEIADTNAAHRIEAESPVSASAEISLPEPLSPWLPQRWVAVGGALLLVVLIWLLPGLRVPQSAASGPGNIFGSNTRPSNTTPVNAEGQWRELNPLPVRRAGMGIVALGGQIYVIGGMTAGGPTDRMDVYLIKEGIWREAAARPLAAANVTTVAIGNRLLVPGGCDADWVATDRVHIYDVDSGTWTEAAPLPVPLCAYALANYDGKAYLMGGWDGRAYQTRAYVYNPDDNIWSALSGPSIARGFGAAATLADRILYVGGYDGRRELDVCEIYLPMVDRWESCARLLQPRGGLGLAAIGGKVYAVGGGWGTYLGFSEFYSPALNHWTVMETPLVGEWRNLGLAAWETSIYAIGGWDSDDFLNLTYAAEVMPWRIFIPGTFKSP